MDQGRLKLHSGGNTAMGRIYDCININTNAPTFCILLLWLAPKWAAVAIVASRTRLADNGWVVAAPGWAVAAVVAKRQSSIPAPSLDSFLLLVGIDGPPLGRVLERRHIRLTLAVVVDRLAVAAD